MSILCVIPVRGGSKGVPGKNRRPIAGRPLVAWTVRQALAAESGLEVVVSTDDDELARIARAAGAAVPFRRPDELAQDTTPTEPVVSHAIEWALAEGREVEGVMLLQATSPIRLPGTIDRAVRQFRESGVDSLVGVVPVSPFLWRLGEPAEPEYDIDHRPRRQDMQPGEIRYRETGSLYLSTPACYLVRGNRLAGRIGMFVMDELEGVDIDTELDFRIAEEQLLHSLGADRAAHAPAKDHA